MAKRKQPEPEAAAPAVMGRPTKYDPAYVEQAQKLCAKYAATDLDLADFFEVNVSTIKLWVLEHPEFSAAVKLNKEVADDGIEASLAKRAHGYEYEVMKVEEVDGKRVRVGTG